MLSDIALFITALGVLGVVFGLRQNYLERLQQFEGKYVARYWDILDRLSLDVLKGAHPDHISAHDSKNIRCYILLCEDELEMRGNGYISDQTYDLWADGIRTQFQQPMFEETWKQVREEAASNQNFPYENLRHLLAKENTRYYDPLIMHAWRKWLRGLTGLRWVRRTPAARIPSPRRPILEAAQVISADTDAQLTGSARTVSGPSEKDQVP
jgi:hypothetical protein